MTKHAQYFSDMLKFNKEIFDSFAEVHARYVKNPKETQAEFNEIGRDIQDVIREWEDKLCNHSESGKYAKFSGQLSEKFWEEIRAVFPKIDYIGVKES